VKLLNGLIKPTDGRVIVDGENTKEVAVSKLAKKVGIVFQNAEKQFFAETVYDELAFAPLNMGFRKTEIESMISKVAKMFGIEQYLERSPFSLSGGEKKRLSIASVLVCDPTYVAIDEPTVGLDFHYRKLLVDLIEKIVEAGKTVLVITHDIDFAVVTARRSILMSNGSVIIDGPLLEVLTNDRIIKNASLIQTFTLGVIKSLKQEGVETDEIDKVMKLLTLGES
jgi:energy-coupling factor transport system ATP-binding protein